LRLRIRKALEGFEPDEERVSQKLDVESNFSDNFLKL
jgi:hypothetical protein